MLGNFRSLLQSLQLGLIPHQACIIKVDFCETHHSQKVASLNFRLGERSSHVVPVAPAERSRDITFSPISRRHYDSQYLKGLKLVGGCNQVRQMLSLRTTWGQEVRCRAQAPAYTCFSLNPTSSPQHCKRSIQGLKVKLVLMSCDVALLRCNTALPCRLKQGTRWLDRPRLPFVGTQCQRRWHGMT